MVDEDGKRGHEKDEGCCEANTRIHSSPQIHAEEDRGGAEEKSI